MPEPIPLIVEHDGAVDDFMSLLLLLCMDEVDLRAVIVTEADCYADPAVSATRSILALAGREDLPVGLSDARAVNPFPATWRAASWTVDSLPILQATHDGPRPPITCGERLLADALRATDEPVTMLVTGPLSCLAATLAAEPALERSIARVVWMGGAVRVPGNVSPFIELEHDGSAEWNAYWDPGAVAAIWRTGLPLTICPLDATDREGLTVADLFPGLIAQRRHAFSDLAGQAYAQVRHQPDYYVWDVTTTAYLAWPELFDIEQLETAIVTDGRSEGRTVVAADGRPVDVITGVDAAALRTRVLERWARD
jgi:purine nucleosidase